ncbi:MAG: hypothetical protein UX91_C0007G0068 [Candidatus Amesbacteria bacterium GW2011_GWB1_47_19]|nr:MAG: hypothetical protein UW51_C0006G0111 [Candidatus Amesbacteria bacterium GW2011_GWA1_44_24]KKU31852.1 MAG: hypothetical protein UX46_C0002G0068 [Candidatus Amesbacteria bacterium GW2011_GWC1_46_24]KKU66788.1 MAG: hypothetical protein UX91_C0007G0068 [Candidatus Amesbacteria bacterium GW2011_GWB1_47_19]OGD06285.1 MAG: hypothetical protein A2379_02675 [Candidatus Amesbacteria bacterium RIFOXYB1_FULL_47_13]HBC73151.1 hypothetical protein [Candidatus Amesbacteria bacterium]
MTLNRPKVSGNDWLDAVFVMLAVLAILHAPMILLDTLMKRDISLVNMFGIVGWQTIWPGVNKGGLSLGISWAALLGLYLVIYRWMKQR